MLGEIKTDALLAFGQGMPLPLLLSVGLFESDKVVEEQAQEEHKHSHHEHSMTITITGMRNGHGHEHHHDPAARITTSHLAMTTADGSIEGFTSLSFQTDKPLGLRAFELPRQQLPATVFRSKGFSGSRKRAAACSTWRANASRSMTPIGRARQKPAGDHWPRPRPRHAQNSCRPVLLTS